MFFSVGHSSCEAAFIAIATLPEPCEARTEISDHHAPEGGAESGDLFGGVEGGDGDS